MDFKQLESFTAVVKYQSFTKAAEVLYISQPTISTHVRMLEEELHSRLIVRTTKNIEVTPRGWELFECASNILGLRDNLIKEWSGETEKMIHLGASTIPSAYILPEILPKFGERFADVYFDVKQSDSKGIIEAMQHGQYDVGLIGMPCTDESLVCLPFYQDRIVLVTPVNEYFLSLKEKTDDPVEILLKEPLILREQGSGSQKSADRFFESVNIREEQMRVVARINDQESIKNLVVSGLGVSVISERAARNFVEEKRLLMFELPQNSSGRYLYLIYNKNYILKTYVKSFVKYVQEYYDYSVK